MCLSVIFTGMNCDLYGLNADQVRNLTQDGGVHGRQEPQGPATDEGH